MRKVTGSVVFLGYALDFVKEVISKKYAIYQLVKRDFAERYAGSYLGLFWVLAQQVAMLSVMWFVLHFGFKVRPAGGISFLAWMVPALALWSFFFEAVNAGASSVVSYSFIVKRIPFKVSILPLVKVLSAACIHALFVSITLVILLLSGISPGAAWLQVFYYFFASLCFVLGLSWLLSSVMVFFRDLAAGIGILLNVWMWLTPIYWNLETLPEKYRLLGYLNPVCYLTEGYRRSLLYQTPAWNEPLWALYFWAVTAGMMLLGISVFRKLKPHFADVL